MEKMIVTRALDERDLLIKKINDAIDRASFVTVKKTSDDIVIGGKKSVQEFDDEARAGSSEYKGSHKQIQQA